MKNATRKNAKKSQSNFKLSPLNSCVAGIDIGAASIFTCAGFSNGHQEVREHLTFTKDLKDKAKWLKKCGIKSIAMESTWVEAQNVPNFCIVKIFYFWIFIDFEKR